MYILENRTARGSPQFDSVAKFASSTNVPMHATKAITQSEIRRIVRNSWLLHGNGQNINIY